MILHSLNIIKKSFDNYAQVNNNNIFDSFIDNVSFVC